MLMIDKPTGMSYIKKNTGPSQLTAAILVTNQNKKQWQ
jgi:hypothetical protein